MPGRTWAMRRQGPHGPAGQIEPAPEGEANGAATAWGGSTTPGHFRVDVEGLRAVAVLAVLAFHARLPGFGGGFVGVDVFYVISGYLITGLLLREIRTSGRIELVAFYARRARRLLPAALLVILVTVVLSYLILTRVEFVRLATDAAAASVYVSNIRFAVTATDYFAAEQFPSPLLHYWSLAVEEQFYLFWPLLMLIGVRLLKVGRLWLMVAAIGAVSFGSALIVARVEPVWTFYSLPTRAWELALGALAVPALGLAPQVWPRMVGPLTSVVGIGLIGFGVVLTSADGPLLGIAGLPAALGALAVIAAGERASTPVSRILATPPFRWIGRISYSLYLWHWPILLLIPRLIDHHGLGTRLALAMITIVIAGASTRFIEDPFRFRWWRGRSARAVLGAGLSASLVLGLATAVVSSPQITSPSKLPELDLFLDEQPVLMRPVFSGPIPTDLAPSLEEAPGDVGHVAIRGCDSPAGDVTPDACIVGEPGAHTTVLVVGDSKAAQWVPAIEALAEHQHWRVVRLTMPRCPFVDLTVWDPELGQPFYACDDWRAYALRTIQREQPVIVFVANRRPSQLRLEHGVTTADWEQGLADALRSVRGDARLVVYVADTPHVKQDPIVCLEREQRLEECPTIPVPPEYRALEASAAAAAGVLLIEPVDWLCVESRCPLVLDRFLVYHDQYHLTATISRLLAPQLQWALGHLDAADSPSPATSP